MSRSLRGRLRRRVAATLPFVCFAALAGALPAQEPAQAELQEPAAGADPEGLPGVLEASAAFSAALVAGDLDALADRYTENALVLPAGLVVKGRQQIREFFRPLPGRQQIAHQMQSEELVVRDDLAIDFGTWVSTVKRGDNEPVTDSERYLAVWSRGEDGRWRMQFDMWHRPAPRPVEPAGPPPASIQLPPELDRVLRDYEAAWRARDAKALAALFTEDGYVLSSGRPPVAGRAAIEKHYSTQGGPLVLRAFHYRVDGDTGYLLGAYATAEGAPDDGKFTLTLRRAGDGAWQIVSDMDNANRPR